MKEKTGVKKSKKIINIIFWVVLALVALYAVIALTAKNDGTRTIFGRTAFTVQTNSMAPTFEKGDLIYDITDFSPEDIKVGDVITYQALIDVNGDGEAEWVYNSHRVVQIINDDPENIRFVTKGDNNSTDDPSSIHESYVIGIWDGHRTKHLGGIIDGIVGFIKSPTGFFVFIVVPCFAFLVYEIIRFVSVMTEYKTQQALSDRVKIQEEALAAARAQLEAEAKQKENENQSKNQTKEEKPQKE